MDIDLPEAEHDGPLQHPNHPRNSFDLSGSTASYYRGSGPAIHLSVEQILQNSTAIASSLATSDEVNSQPIDLHIELVPARVDY